MNSNENSVEYVILDENDQPIAHDNAVKPVPTLAERLQAQALAMIAARMAKKRAVRKMELARRQNAKVRRSRRKEQLEKESRKRNRRR